jgi:hypothetical protein
MADHIYVVAHDGRSEGWGAPMLAFADKEDATRIRALMEASGNERFGVFRVPVWPTTQPLPWYSVEEEPRA